MFGYSDTKLTPLQVLRCLFKLCMYSYLLLLFLFLKRIIPVKNGCCFLPTDLPQVDRKACCFHNGKCAETELSRKNGRNCYGS